MKKPVSITLNYLALTVVFVNLLSITTNTKIRLNGIFQRFHSIVYIRGAAGRVLFHWSQYLSLSTDLFRRFYFSTPAALLTTKDNDTMQIQNQPHYLTTSRLYNIYYCMKDRCFNPKNKSFYRYGGRGITVCTHWKENRNAFIDWALENGYADNLQIDRIDNDGIYEPENCRWVTNKENCRNTSANLKIYFGGEVKSLAEWCEILNISYSATQQRFSSGWSVEDAFSPLYNTHGDEYEIKKQKIAQLQIHLDSMLFFFDANSIVTKWDKLKNKSKCS
jgi:hypothetical protein